MATGPSYRVAFRRRREGKTDYQQRRGFVSSGQARLVVRGSLRNMTVEIVKAESNGDRVIAYAHSGELTKKYGWLGDTGNISAAYLSGLLCGLKTLRQGVKEAVLDIGLRHPSKGSRVFAALQGVLDAGLVLPFDKEKLPDPKRITGEHVAEYARLLSANPDAYRARFSALMSRGLKPEEISAHFTAVKERIVSSFQNIKSTERSEKDGRIEETVEED